MDLNAIWADVQANWWLYCLLPVIAASIGYVTKIMAIKMMFQPLKFIGIRPIGWQGVVPARAEAMANIACDTLMRDLIDPQELFGRLDPERVAQEIEQPLLNMVDDITREVLSAQQPGLWEAMPERMRKALIKRVQKEAPQMIEDIMQDVRSNIHQVFDLRDLVVSNLTRDIELLNRMFQSTGAKEFAFIRNSGIYFGFAIGLVQAVVWALTHNPWVMPIFGGLTGWLTDWLALKLIFEPREEKRVFGLFRWQGMFMKRRDEVAEDYGTILANEILTPAHITDSILRGPLSDQLFTMVQKHIQRAVDDQASIAKPFMVMSMGGAGYQQMKKNVAERVMERAPEALKHIEEYTADALDLKNTVIEKIRQLSDEDFESLLRPIFKQEEWKLIAVGAVLGFLVGELQVQVMLQ